MKKVLDFAIILTEKHQELSLKIGDSCRYSTQKDLRKKQLKITQQIIQFLEEVQEYKELLILNPNTKDQYHYLVNYYAVQIHNKINQFQLKKDLKSFETKFDFNPSNQNKIEKVNNDLELIQSKMDNYYQFFK